jgi:hypothetical protein
MEYFEMNSPGGVVKKEEDHQSEKSKIILKTVTRYLLMRLLVFIE